MFAHAQKPAQSKTAPAGGVLQHKHDKCCKKTVLQRSAFGPIPEIAPPQMHRVLRSPGQTSDLDARPFAEPRLAHDLSKISICSRLQARIQPKLTVNTPPDIYEQEADRIADRVLAMPAHHVVSGVLPRIQRLSGHPAGQMDAVPTSVNQALANPGSPLEPTLRRDMEGRFGHDFSRVRMHTGMAAEQSAHDVNAHAYTVGHNVVFGAGRFIPGTHEGRRLIAHELTHVVQQSLAGAALQRKPVLAECPPHYEPGEEDKSHTTKGILDSKVAHAGYFSVLPEFKYNDPDAIVVADFEVNSGEIRPSTKSYLTQLVSAYKPTDTLEFIGFSDCIGLESRNLFLREKRAKVVANVFFARHWPLFPSSRLKLIGAAPFYTYPPTGQYLAKNASVTGRALNRSVIIRHKVPSATDCKSCPFYCGYDTAKSIKKYNCAGLAFRTYVDYYLHEVKEVLEKRGSKISCGTPCDKVGMIKFWLWEYDGRAEDSSGKVLRDYPRDFHMVGGPTVGTRLPKDSAEFYSKNGHRKVYGPRTAPSFRPPAKEQSTSDDEFETPDVDDKGNPVYWVRFNFEESCYCFRCPESLDDADW